MSLEQEIRKAALLNAVEFGGKSSDKAIAGKILGAFPDARKNVPETMKLISGIVSEVNRLGLEKQQAEIATLGMVVEKKRHVDEGPKLPELPNAVKGKVVTAFPPEPSGFPHIGHAKGALVNYLYAKEYDGKFILRFEDTNPELAKPEFYEAQMDGFKWLGITFDQVINISDTMDLMYEKAEKMLSEGKFYACKCSGDELSELRTKGKACKHRKQAVSTNLKEWKKMLSGEYDEGIIIIRWKGDLKSQNTAMRDPTMLRISKKPHCRHGTKYVVWPTYDFAVAMSDGSEGVTHRVRSKEYELRAEVQTNLQQQLGYKPTIIIEQARFNVEGVEASKRKIRDGIAKGELLGWDDPRLTTLIALKKRGFTPEGLKNFLLRMGVTKKEATVTWDAVEAENRKVVDPIAHRFFFVEDPVEVDISKTSAAGKTAEVPSPIPDVQKPRKVTAGKKVLITKADFSANEGKPIRFRYLIDGTLDTHFKEGPVPERTQVLQWVPADDNVAVEVIMPDASRKHGFAEKNILSKIGDVVQFERFGFVKLYDNNGKIVAYYTHK